MKRCKLVISDFHIGAGPLLEEGEVNPLEHFIYDSRFISFLDYYCSDEFKRAEVELVINGDFLDSLQVEYDGGFPLEITETVALEKMRKIMAGHPELFDALASFAAAPNHSVTYIYGNHDTGVMWPSGQELLDQRLSAKVRYPGFRYSFDGIRIEHGHQYQSSNHFDPHRLFVKNDSGEIIVNLPWGCLWVVEYLNAIKKERPYIDRVQPFNRYLLLGLFLDTRFALKALFRLARFFIRERGKWGNFTSLDEIKRTFRILKDITIIPRLDREARRVLSSEDLHTVIFGHNHQPAYRKFGKDKLYVNTGTWNDIIHLDLQNLGRTRRMTYAFIDYPDKEKPRTRLKIWKGTRQPEENVIF